MKRKFGFAGLGLMLSVAIAFGALASVASAKTNSPGPKTTGSLTVPADGTVVNGGTADAGSTFTIQRFVNQDGQLTAVGVFNGTIDNVPTGPTPASAVVTDPPSSACQVLDLTLGPLHLDLLGLVVDLNQVHLQITAQPGSGNLLGNLLCAVTGLLDNSGGTGGALNGITALLNQILGILSTL